jgi:predicted signal transduction protein with EAL and GGDEF domain
LEAFKYVVHYLVLMRPSFIAVLVIVILVVAALVYLLILNY